MEIAFEEIMVGERGRAHAVLASSLPDDIARSLAHHLDLPGTIAAGFSIGETMFPVSPMEAAMWWRERVSTVAPLDRGWCSVMR